MNKNKKNQTEPITETLAEAQLSLSRRKKRRKTGW